MVAKTATMERVTEAPLSPMRPVTLLEAVLRSDKLTTLLLLIAVPAVSWAWIVVMARDMYGPMNGASAWMMTSSWDASHVFLLWAMWAVMMTAMMLPSATPMILVYATGVRRRQDGDASFQAYALAAGYLVTWALFSVAATALQRVLASFLVVSPMMELTNSKLGGALLCLAGVYQFTPFKRACLSHCQSPLGFLVAHWREGVVGAFRMGWEHGFSCLGCCWALMLLLFVGGVMNLAVIAGLTAFVAFEKFGLFGRQGARISGVLLALLGVWMFVR
jgi:predicted metal-binding membrane protein